MITKELEAEILTNKIEITLDNFKSLIQLPEFNDFDIPKELYERTLTYDLHLSEDFYYITEDDSFIIDFLDPRARGLFFYGSRARILFKKDCFVEFYVGTKLWVAKINWFYPKNEIIKI